LPKKTFILSANINSNSPAAIEPALKRFIGTKGSVKNIEGGFQVEAKLEGDSAKNVNRQLLSEMRRIEKRTRLRAEWTYGSTIEKFFDYAPKGVRKTDQDSKTKSKKNDQSEKVSKKGPMKPRRTS
jgi:hypothetical protein